MIAVGIDRGGTFTDAVGIDQAGRLKALKVLSSPTSSIEAVMLLAGGVPQRLRFGSTIATNALLELKGQKTALAVTAGFKDLLQIRYQNRPRIFELDIKKLEGLHSGVVEIDQRVVLREPCVQRALDKQKVKIQLQTLRKEGYQSLAVALMHSNLHPKHELEVGQLAKEAGFSNVILSHHIAHRKIVERAETAVLEAYIRPKVQQYVKTITSQFKEAKSVLFMCSDGGLVRGPQFTGVGALMSGPAGGYIGYSLATYTHEFNQERLPVIGFDMGGTSTDVSRFAGSMTHTHISKLAGRNLVGRKLDIETVAAGGGSRLFFENGLFRVGPESAGADPGPVCYLRNGHLAITDANLVLGRLDPQHFPQSFGPEENSPISRQAAYMKFQEMAVQVGKKGLTVQQLAMGFVRIANENMANAVRAITQRKGLDPAKHILSVFGGAGAQHCCEIAQLLGIQKIFINRFCGVLSALGILFSQLAKESERLLDLELRQDKQDQLVRLYGQLQLSHEEYCRLYSQEAGINHSRFIRLKYHGSDSTIELEFKGVVECLAEFHGQHVKRFGFGYKDSRAVIATHLRVRTTWRQFQFDKTEDQFKAETVQGRCKVYIKGEWVEVPLLRPLPRTKRRGPAMLALDTSTVFVSEGWAMEWDSEGHTLLSRQGVCLSRSQGVEELSLFGNRFMQVAEDMGRVLQNTAISTNIKQRLDFSCAVFDQRGQLVANAPHIPVHLGSMGDCVRHQIIERPEWREGDVYMTNHPAAGGTHLPDITLVSAVFIAGRPQFYLAARGHHADIGGLTPGSMPPFSKSLAQEGLAVKSFKLVDKGILQEDELRVLLKDCRQPKDNDSDLKAQLAALACGRDLLKRMVDQQGLERVVHFMAEIADVSQRGVRQLLRRTHGQLLHSASNVVAEDYMDDGSLIRLELSICPEAGSATFDFRGSGAQVLGNWNAPRSITKSAVLYCLRCMLGSDLPLNEGFLRPVKIIYPEQPSLLAPTEDAAVVGGNVLTSQRVVDVVLQAFRAAANSYGDMNNLTFGTENWGYYETIGGGSGAGPGFHGATGVQCHMTNTLITDPEILESRYPVQLVRFEVRKGSGGKGRFKGGDGLIREIRFQEEVTVSFLGERRSRSPKGLEGGGNGSKGRTELVREDGVRVSVGGKNSWRAGRGWGVVVWTSGGGGFWGE